MDHFSKKMDIINDLLDEISTKKSKNYLKLLRIKRLSTVNNTLINVFNCVSIITLIYDSEKMNDNGVAGLIALISTSLSSLVTAFNLGCELESKIQHFNTSYQQYSDLFREIKARIEQNHLDSKGLDSLLSEINSKLSLIEDSSLPI